MGAASDQPFVPDLHMSTTASWRVRGPVCRPTTVPSREILLDLGPWRGWVGQPVVTVRDRVWRSGVWVRSAAVTGFSRGGDGPA